MKSQVFRKFQLERHDHCGNLCERSNCHCTIPVQFSTGRGAMNKKMQTYYEGKLGHFQMPPFSFHPWWSSFYFPLLHGLEQLAFGA
jgi:hypothetical protein